MVAEGPHTPHTNNGINGAKGAPSAAAGGGLAGWWAKMTGANSKPLDVKNHASNIRAALQNRKFSMPVNVKVDVLRPAIETVKEAALNAQLAFYSLPPQVQTAAPFVGVALGSGLVVFLVQQRRVNYHRLHGEELESQVKTLRKDKEELLKRINLLKAKSGTPRTEVEARMASAVAEATNAAAAAADAAARAATACIFQRPPPVSNGPMLQ